MASSSRIPAPKRSYYEERGRRKAANLLAQGAAHRGNSFPRRPDHSLVLGGILGGLYLLFRDDYPSDEAKSAVSGSWYRIGNSLYSSSEPPRTFPFFGFTRCAWAHARHVTWT